jgi:hypothetical protein
MPVLAENSVHDTGPAKGVSTLPELKCQKSGNSRTSGYSDSQNYQGTTLTDLFVRFLGCIAA